MSSDQSTAAPEVNGAQANGTTTTQTEKRVASPAAAATANQNVKQQQQQQPLPKDETGEAAQEAKDNPHGGHDSTPIERRPPGYTVKITFHGATKLPIADLSDLSSDPYIHATLTTDLPLRHKDDPLLRFRTRTLWRTTDPRWEEPWILAHVPASGFKLKARLYDEDSSDKDDRLGNVHITVDGLDENWEGIHKQNYKIKKRSGSWRAYALRAVAVCLGKAEEMSGHLNVSVECLGRSEGDNGGRCYTIGPNYWCKHYSPLLGRILHQREPSGSEPDGITTHPNEHPNFSNGTPSDRAAANGVGNEGSGFNKKKRENNLLHGHKAGQYNFQANQMQLQGPVPADLYHRYVDSRPLIKAIFTSKGIRGILLHKAFLHQHQQVYNFNRKTEYGRFEHPSNDMTSKFLDLVHYDEGGRLFTYVITLDALMRFTETGKEFSIDLLSKHTMHSNAEKYIAFSGEFFIRRLKHPYHPTTDANENKPAGESDTASHSAADGQATHPPNDLEGGPPHSAPPRDPSHYELILDNDSGTYQPGPTFLPELRQFLQRSFPGLKIVTVDGRRDEKLLNKLKEQQRERKKREGTHIVYTQVSRRSSVSSSDEKRLDRLQEDFANGNGKSGKEAEQKKHKLGEAVAPLVSDHQHLRAGLLAKDKDGNKEGSGGDGDGKGTGDSGGGDPKASAERAGAST